MKKTYYKNLFRDIKKTLSRFLSIVVIIAVGVAFYAGVRATKPDMLISGDLYLEENNFMDFKIISTLGLTEDDIMKVSKQPGISNVKGSYSIDAVIEKDDRSMVLNINSLPSNNGINILRLLEGREPKNNYEAIVEARFLENNKLKIGDEIKLESGKDSKIEDDLNNATFEIVGSAESPLYLSAQRQLSSVGNGSVQGFVYILPTVFKSEVYTEMYVKIDNVESKDSLLNNEEYKKVVKNIEKSFEDLGIIRSKVRYEEILKTAQDKITEAEDKLQQSKKEALEKIADGYQELEDGQSKIEEGKIEVSNNQTLFEKEIADGEKRIADGKKQLIDAKEKIRLGKEQAAANISSALKEQVLGAKTQLASDPENPMFVASYEMLNQLYKNDIKGKTFDNMYLSLQEHGNLEQMNTSFDITTLKNNFDKAELEIKQNEKKIAESEIQLIKSQKEGQEKLDEATDKLAKNQVKIDKNLAKLKEEENKANQKIKDGEIKISENKEKLKDIKLPIWYILGRSTNIGYETYRLDSDRVGNVGKAFPFIFFLVAALVSLTTMTRLVQENRTEIGTFKALGYSKGAIVSHYLIYSFTASLMGSIIGLSFAFQLFPKLIMNAYVSLYTIPNQVTPFNQELALQASLIAILFTTIAAVIATLEELREAPASLMRPKPPKLGKTILLERVTFIWKRLSFTKKVTARNLFRYKQRLFMTVIGIAMCTGLMITGFGLKSGVIGATQNQFNKIYQYDMQTHLTKNIDTSNKDSMKDKVMENKNVSSLLFFYSKNTTVTDQNLGEQEAYVIVPETKDALNSYINLTMKNKGLKLEEEGVIITQKLSKLLGKKIGDTIRITINDKVAEAEISAITEHYLQHYIYISPKYYKEITGETLEYNAFYGLLKSTSEVSEDEMSKTLVNIKNIASVSYRNNIYMDYDKSMESINSVVIILIISAGVLAFIVIYNLTNINISERRRELATIKLLGFYNKELASYIYKENIILTIIGSFTGIIVGIMLNNFVLNTAETNILMFLKRIEPIYFLYSVLLTILFSIIVNLIMYSKFDKIDMIESLKSAE